MRRAHLEELRPGIYANPADKDFSIKAMRYRKMQPDSPLHEARMLVRAGHYQKAKRVYLDLLQQKESIWVHQQLAPLLRADELSNMIAQYEGYPSVQKVYYKHLPSPEAPSAYSFGQGLLWTLLISFLALLIVLPALYFIHQRIVTIDQTSTVHNSVDHIGTMPNSAFTGHISLPQGATVEDISNTVDHAHMVASEPYQLLESGKTVGYAVRQGSDKFAIHLLSGGQARTSNGQTGGASNASAATGTTVASHVQTTAPLSNFQLNTIRTAYDYYLSKHQDTPPTSLKVIQPLIPGDISLSSVDYTPAVDPALAIQSGSQANDKPVPFQKPYIYVNLKTRTLRLIFNNVKMYETPVGVGNQTAPTPTGEFTVTDRLVNHGAKVYGQYIFPLNGSNYAIHGTDTPSRIGQADSIGCIELPNRADKRLYNLIAVGTPVVIQNSDTQAPPSWFR